MTDRHVADPPRTAFLPPPRIPQSASHPWPPAALLDDLDDDAAAVAGRADELRREVWDAIGALEAGRPGGADWVAARQQDRDMVLNRDGRKRGAPKQMAGLLDGEHTRYGIALALASTISERLDALRGQLATDRLISTVADRRKQVDAGISDAAFAAYTAASKDEKGAGWTQLEQYDRLVGQGRALVALRKWLTGESTTFDPSPPYPVTRSVYDWTRDARTMLAGGSVDRNKVAS